MMREHVLSRRQYLTAELHVCSSMLFVNTVAVSVTE